MALSSKQKVGIGIGTGIAVLLMLMGTAGAAEEEPTGGGGGGGGGGGTGGGGKTGGGGLAGGGTGGGGIKPGHLGEIPHIYDPSTWPTQDEMNARPAGKPPGGCKYYWAKKLSDDPQGNDKLRIALANLGYDVPVSYEIYGPDGVIGTEDATPSAYIANFQNDYNGLSGKKILGTGGKDAKGKSAGGLDVDGLMGPCTMAAMKHAAMTLGGAKWKEQVGL